jgi:hypothetical protein
MSFFALVNIMQPEDAASPLFRVDDSPGFPIYRVTAQPDKLYLQWVRNRAHVGPDGDLVNASATLGEWYNFKESVREMVSAIVKPHGKDGHRKSGFFDGCPIA